jgi:hypothetical protein
MSHEQLHLTVLTPGPLLGRTYTLERGHQLVGRGGDADVVVDWPDLSRNHAYVSWDGRSAAIADAGSTNGTAVNREPVRDSRQLSDGDVLRLGSLELRVDVAGALPSPNGATFVAPAWSNHFGTNHGEINQAGRDLVRNWHDHRYDIDDPLEELFKGRGAGRLLMALGLIVALTGFGGWMYVIFSGFGSTDPMNNPFDSKVLGFPGPALAFAAFAIGGILASIGHAMSRAGRARRSHLERVAMRPDPRW